MIRTHAFVDGKLETREGVGTVGWVEAVAPTAAEQQALVTTLGVHELPIEDALASGHPPKVEEFDDYLFIIAHTPVVAEDRTTRKLSIFLGKRWIVTIAREALEDVSVVVARVEKNAATYLEHPAALAHVILDRMTDGFESRVDDLSERVESIEEQASASPEPEQMEQLLELRREVAGILRVVRGQRDVCLSLARIDNPLIPKKLRPYFRDVYDHVLRVNDLLEGVREAIVAARDAYLASTNNRLSEVMRVLTIIATIMMPLSLIAGVYGMNFSKTPGIDNPLGFWLTLVAMVLIACGMVVFFRVRKWI